VIVDAGDAASGRPPASPAADHAPGLERAFSFVPEERADRLAVEGRLPAFVRGSYYSNGPARFRRGGLAYRHWLDGDGMVSALHLASGAAEPEVRFVNRFVRSAKWTAEEAAGAALFRAFGTGFPGDRLVRGLALESPVNVSAFPYGGALLAFGEQGLPWELDPLTLETRGPSTLSGALNPLSPFAAHPKIDPATGELFNFGISFSRERPVLNLYRFDAAGRLAYRRRLPLDWASSLHDFCLTPRHAVFYLAPYLLDMELLTRDGRTLMESLSWQPERGSRLLVASRDSGEAVAAVPIGERYSLHAINGFEAGDRLTVDVLELDRPVYDQYQEIPHLFRDVAPGRPVRFEIDLAKGRLAGRREIAYDRAPDFAAIDPRRFGQAYDDLWLLGISAQGKVGRKFFDEIVRLAWSRPAAADLWRAPAGSYLGGEPAFVPDPEDERGGAVLCQLFDAGRGESSFLVFDAFDLAAGPVARLPLASPLHLGFHALFAPAERR
jgi:all-trans-8'-apo-beta-carotenal 15,15'-oxygenase